MRFTPEVRSILRPQSVQLMLLTALAFGAASTVFSAPLTAQTQQALPTTMPDLSGYDSRTRQSMEIACASQNVNGPVAYGACLNRQISSLRSSPGIPDLSGYDGRTRQSMEIACASQNANGPVAYGACLNRQISSLRSSPGIPDLSGYEGRTRQSMEIACASQNANGPVAYGACLNRQIASLQSSPGIPSPSGNDSQKRQTAPTASSSAGANSDKSKRVGTAVTSVNGMSRFTTENIMKIHGGMDSDKILDMFGAPKNVSQSVCGAAVGTPWTCTTWVYREPPYEWASFTFSGANGSLVLNNFDIHRK